MHYVYIPRSVSHPKQIFVGCTRDLKNSLSRHNSGKSAHMSRHAMHALPYSAGE